MLTALACPEVEVEVQDTTTGPVVSAPALIESNGVARMRSITL